MKSIVISFLTLFMFLSSCDKDDYLIPSNEVPEWLKSKIRQDEQTIKDQPQLMNSYGAWLRFSWKNDYYFEYHNELSSSLPIAKSFNGDNTIQAYINNEYNNEKCCETLVWKGPKYDGFKGI